MCWSQKREMLGRLPAALGALLALKDPLIFAYAFFLGCSPLLSTPSPWKGEGWDGGWVLRSSARSMTPSTSSMLCHSS